MGTVFDKPKTDLELHQMAELSAIQGMQFGREVFSGIIKFKDLQDFLEVFPEVQRDIIPRKVASIKRYIISGLEKTDTMNMRFFNAITVTCKGTIFYDAKRQRIALNTNEVKLSVNDGQHRMEAVTQAIEQLEQDFVKSNDKDKTAKLRKMIDDLKDMIIPIVIFNDLSVKEEKQLFYDLNNLSARPSRSANIRLNQKDLYSIMAKELAETNKYLVHYGVEMDKQSLSPKNKNGILLTTIYSSIKELLTHEFKHNKNRLHESNYEFYKKIIDETFNNLFMVLPADLNVKGKYLLEKSYPIRAISKFICHARNHLDLQLTEEQIFETIGSIDFSFDNIDFWAKYNGLPAKQSAVVVSGGIVFGGGTGGGYSAVYNALVDASEEIVSGKRVGKVNNQATLKLV